ncbi:MAG: extracellular solute-binding protein [Lachnospiraceae bacterium]|nr:extracellular solute-binding protein [Lachnospiraceae bacterium]
MKHANHKNTITLTGLACAASLLLLGGCSTAPKESGEIPASGNEQQVIPLTFWYSGGKTAAGVMEEIIQEFNASQNTWQITGIQQADYDETYMKLQAGIAGDHAADLALLDADKSYNLMQKNLLADLESYMASDPDFDRSDFIPVFFDQCQTDGKMFAMPAYGTTQVLYYNQKLMQQAGIQPETLTTWQALADAAKQIQATAGADVYGWEPMWGADNLIDMALSNGGSLLSADGTTVTIDSNAWVDAWESARQWIHDDHTMRIHSGGQGWEYWYSTMDDVLNDRAGGYTGSSGDQADLDFSKVTALEQPGFGTNPAAPVARVLQLIMPNSGSKERMDGAYAFLKYFSAPSNQAKWSIATGYIPVRQSTLDDATYKAHTAKNPNALVPFTQAMHASPLAIDPTGGKIYDALDIAADQVELENTPARQALQEACQTAQTALDEVLGTK